MRGEVIVKKYMSLNKLRTFDVAARHLSFTKAADELNVTQGAVSHQIARLEKNLSVKLFNRNINDISLTEDGEKYREAISSAFRQIDEATEQVRQRGDKEVLVISTLASLASKWLLPRLASFRSQNPDIEVRISTTTDLEDFRGGKIDAAIRYGLGRWQSVDADWLMADEIFPVCSPNLVESGLIKQPSDLANQTILHTVGVTNDDWKLWLTAVGLPTSLADHKRMSFDLNFMMVQAAIDGLGVAIGRTSYVAEDIRAGRLVVPFHNKLPAEAGFYFVAPRKNMSKSKVAAFRAWILSIASEARG